MFKRLTIICTILVLICAVTFTAYAVPSPQPISYYKIITNVKGTGEASCNTDKIEISSDNICTFTATETDEPFVFWNITGDYDIVSGDYEELIFTIRPRSDIVAVATFDDGLIERAVPVNLDTSPISPKTGDNRAQQAVWLMIFPIILAFAVFIINRNNRPKY